MSNLAKTFAALGDPTRFAITERLLREGEQPVGAICEGFRISAPAVSRHLDRLRRAGIVRRRVHRQQRIYSVTPEAMQTIAAWTMGHRAFWKGSLERLEQALKAEMSRK